MHAESGAGPSFRIDADAQRLSRAGQDVRIPPKVFALLLHLVENAGRILTREDLLAAVWPGVTVTGEALRYTMHQLRLALGDANSPPRFVETLPRRGWRFVGRVIPIANGLWRFDAGPTHDPSAEPRRASGAPAPLVGRQRELEQLVDAVERARSGTRQLVLVSGEAGIGKTALVDAALHLLSGTADLRIARGQCIARHGASEPYLPVLEALERLAGASDRNESAGVLRQHAPMWLAQLPSLTDPEERETLQRQIQGASPARMIRELNGALEILSRERTLILWIDDLHWSDLATLEWLQQAMRRDEPARLLVIAGHRSADLDADTSRRFGALRALAVPGRGADLPLGLLGAAALEEYLDRRFGGTVPPRQRATLAEFLLDRTEGNPLFVVSVVDDLLDRGVVVSREGRFRLDGALAGLPTPSTLQRLLEQEIEHVDPDDRELLELASIAGMEFSAAALATDSGPRLAQIEERCEALARRGRFLVARGASDWPDGTVASRFAFRHALHRDAFESRIGPGRRRRLHVQIGLRKERAFEGHELQVAAELAHHFERSEDASRAVRYLTLAGEEAARRFANGEAVTLLRRGLELLPRIAPSAERDAQELMLRLPLNVPLAAVDGYGAPELERNLLRIRELTGSFGEADRFFPVLLGLWSLNLVRADMLQAGEIGTRLLAAAERSGDALSRLQGHRAYGHVRFYRGFPEESCALIESGLAGYDLSEPLRLDYSAGDDPVVLSFAYLSWALWFQGLPRRAVERVEQAVERGRGLRHPPSHAIALAFRAIVQLLRRDAPAARQAARELEAVARDEGMALWLALVQIVDGWALQYEVPPREALEALDRGIAAWRQTGSGLGLPYWLCLRVEILAASGEVRDGFGTLRDVERLIGATGQEIFEAERHRAEGLLRSLAEPRDRQAVEHSFRAAIGVAREMGALSIELRAALSWAEFERRETGRLGAASHALLRGLLERLPEGGEDLDPRAAARLLAITSGALVS